MLSYSFYFVKQKSMGMISRPMKTNQWGRMTLSTTRISLLLSTTLQCYIMMRPIRLYLVKRKVCHLWKELITQWLDSILTKRTRLTECVLRYLMGFFILWGILPILPRQRIKKEKTFPQGQPLWISSILITTFSYSPPKEWMLINSTSTNSRNFALQSKEKESRTNLVTTWTKS